jgi:hypothetical protein
MKHLELLPSNRDSKNYVWNEIARKHAYTRLHLCTCVHSSVRMYQVLFSHDTQNIQLLLYNMYYKYMFSLLYSYTKQHLFTALFANV